MKILHIIYSLSSGGAERFLVDLANELSQREDCDVRLLILKTDQDERNVFYKNELCIRVHLESLGIRKMSLSLFFKLYHFIKKENPNIVHIHLSPIVLYCLLPITFMRKPVYIETVHNEVARIDNGSKIKRLLKLIVYRIRLVRICTTSDKNAIEYKKVYGRECDVMIYNGRKHLSKSLSFEAIKKEVESYKYNNSTLVITHIARCAVQKNQDLLIDAFNEIISQKHNVILLIIGSGFDSEKGNELKRRAHNGIYFLGEKHNVQDYLLCSDAFCLSSIYEGLPITLIEALACGCIPLSTPVSGVVDLVVNNENGFISANFTLDSYVEMLLRYLKNHESINKQRLLELFRAKLSMRACAESYYDFYKYCLNNVGTGE